MITFGLAQIMVGIAGTDGSMPVTLTKIGKVHQDSCKMVQAAATVTEHYEEGKAVPEVRVKQKKTPVVTFDIMDPDPAFLAAYLGGSVSNSKWGYDGTEVVTNVAVQIQADQGMWTDIPNADIEAVIDADMSKKGIFLVKFTVTPCAVSGGKSFYSYPGGVSLTVSPTSLDFTSSADSTGQTITASATGNVTSASKPSADEWLTVTRSGKVVTVKVAANPNSEPRTTSVTIVADGVRTVVPVTQAGA